MIGFPGVYEDNSSNLRKFAMADYNHHNLKAFMFLHNLSEKLSESLDTLAKLLDSIHRFPQHQRKHYFEQIQTFKNQLLSLRSQLRQSNALQTERKYHTIHLALTSLTNNIHQETTQTANKENRHPNHPGFIRQSKKTYQDALRLLAEKDQEIQQLKQTLFEKEQLIKLNYEELREYHRDCNLLAHQNHTMTQDLAQFKAESKDLNCRLDETEAQLTELRLMSQDQQRQLRIKDQAIQRATDEIIAAKDRILDLQRLADLSMKKTVMVEESIQRVQEQAAFLNCNYKQREEESIQQHKQIETLKYQLRVQQKNFYMMEQQNIELKHNIQTLKEQISSLQHSLYAIEKQKKQDQNKYDIGLAHFKQIARDCEKRQTQIAGELQQSESRFIELYNQLEKKSEEVDSLLAQIEERQGRQKIQKQNFVKLETQIQTIRKQSMLLQQQKVLLAEQLQTSSQTNKQYEQNLSKMKEKTRNQQENIIKLNNQINKLHLEIQQHQHDSNKLQAAHNTFTSQIQKYKQKIVSLQKEASARAKIEEELRRRLLKAKVDALRQIRSSLDL